MQSIQNGSELLIRFEDPKMMTFNSVEITLLKEEDIIGGHPDLKEAEISERFWLSRARYFLEIFTLYEQFWN